MDENDVLLLQLMSEQPEKGIEALIGKYSGYVYAIVRNRLYGVCAAEDIEETMSDVFSDLYFSRDRIDLSLSPLRGYISVIAKRSATDRYRRETNRPARVSADDDDAGLEEIPSDESVELTAEDDDERKRLTDAVKALGEPDSSIVFRKYWLCQTAREIAEALSLSPNAVIKRLLRAKTKLRGLLSDTGTADERI